MTVSFYHEDMLRRIYALLCTIQSIHPSYLLTADRVDPSLKPSFSLLYRILIFQMLVFNV